MGCDCKKFTVKQRAKRLLGRGGYDKHQKTQNNKLKTFIIKSFLKKEQMKKLKTG
jgi:hypothetical protein